MYFKILTCIVPACNQDNGDNAETTADLDADYSIPSPDLGFFGSQDMTIQMPCLLDSILAQSPRKPKDESKLVKFLAEVTTSPSHVALCDQKLNTQSDKK